MTPSHGRMSGEGRRDEQQLEQAQREGEALRPFVRRGQDDDAEQHAPPKRPWGPRQAEDLRGAGDAGKLRDECRDVGDEHRAQRDPCPAHAVVLANQPRVAFAGDRAQAHGHLLHDEQRHDQQQLQQDQLEAELRAGGRSGRDAAGFGIREHDDEPGAEHGQETNQPAPQGVGPGGGCRLRRRRALDRGHRVLRLS